MAATAPSFAHVLLQSLDLPALPLATHAPAFTDSGESAAFFNMDEIHVSCRPLELALIARTPHGRPPFQEIRAHLACRFVFKKDYLISSMDRRYLLFCFHHRDDYLQVLLKDSLLVRGKPLTFFKWSINFSTDEDSLLVPVWVEMPPCQLLQ